MCALYTLDIYKWYVDAYMWRLAQYIMCLRPCLQSYHKKLILIFENSLWFFYSYFLLFLFSLIFSLLILFSLLFLSCLFFSLIFSSLMFWFFLMSSTRDFFFMKTLCRKTFLKNKTQALIRTKSIFLGDMKL